MRCLFEVIGTGTDTARFPRRNGGGVDEVPFFWMSGIDTDFEDQMIKVKVFRKFESVRKIAVKGGRLQVKFRTLKRDDKFEHCTVITVNEEDVQSFVQPAMAVAA